MSNISGVTQDSEQLAVDSSSEQRGTLVPIGSWEAGSEGPCFSMDEIAQAVERERETAHIIRELPDGRLGIGFGGQVSINVDEVRYPLMGTLPPLYPEWLGDRVFCEVHNLRYPYVTGAMANGIASTAIVIEMARAGMLGFFGSAGLVPNEVEKALEELENALGNDNLSYGSNLMHTPNDPALEEALIDLYLRRGVKRADAAAFMRLTPSVVRYAVSGLQLNPSNQIVRRNHLFAKVSRPEVAQLFMSPAPAEILQALRQKGQITEQEAELATKVPLAEDIIVEADSGGHTDNRPMAALFTTITGLRDRLIKENNYEIPIRVGAAGGIGTPTAAASAFSLGASFILTGSINQASVEANTSYATKEMLAKAEISDVMMAPSADMFEIGAKVQVLKRGTMWAVKAQKLFEYFRTHNSFEEIPETDRGKIERDFLRDSFQNTWNQTKAYFIKQDPRQIEQAQKNPKHKMALVFRWYLGMGSRWAIDGIKDRTMDYQIWCGPAQGAFNDWVKGSFLEPVENRNVVQMALNLLEGAAVITRAQQFRNYGVPVPSEAFGFRPRRLK